MEILADTIENLLKKELVLYKELQSILEKEKRYIVDMDIDSLWKTIAQKKQITVELESLNKKMLKLIETRADELSMDSSSLKLSDYIKKLPVSQKIKSKLRTIKLGLETYKKSVSSLAFTNKTYINESLAVINDIVSTVVDSADNKQYNTYGDLLKKKKKIFISAEV